MAILGTFFKKKFNFLKIDNLQPFYNVLILRMFRQFETATETETLLS